MFVAAIAIEGWSSRMCVCGAWVCVQLVANSMWGGNPKPWTLSRGPSPSQPSATVASVSSRSTSSQRSPSSLITFRTQSIVFGVLWEPANKWEPRLSKISVTLLLALSPILIRTHWSALNMKKVTNGKAWEFSLRCQAYLGWASSAVLNTFPGPYGEWGSVHYLTAALL